ncbi:MAG: prolyl oligopeptidase family serine peptidase [Bryobacteraceae bacterium]
MRRFFLLLLPAWLVLAAPTPFTVDDLLDLANVQVADLSADGRFAAVTTMTLRGRLGIDNSRFGDPTYIAPGSGDLWRIDTQSGQRQLILEKSQTRNIRFSEDGLRLAIYVVENGEFVLKIWERGQLHSAKLPAGKIIDETSEPVWSGANLIVGLRDAAWRARAHQAFEALTSAPIVVQSSKDPFLSWIALRLMSAERSVVLLNPATGQATELAPSGLHNQYHVTEDKRFLITYDDILKKTDYDHLGLGESRVEVRALADPSAKPRTLLASTKDSTPIWSRNSRFYAFAKKDGSIWFGGIEDEQPRELIAKKKEDPKKDDAKTETAGDNDASSSEKLTPTAVTPDGSALIATNKEGIWWISTRDATQRSQIVKADPDNKEAPRWSVVEALANRVYLGYGARTEWSRGLSAWDPSTKQTSSLFRDARLHGAFRLSRNESTWVYTAANGNRPLDLYSAPANLNASRLLLEPNPQLKDKAFSKTELVAYLDADGKKLRGVLYYPVNYESGKKYPTVFLVYEQFFDDTFNGTIAVLNAHGYAVMEPSVDLEQGYPGESWEKGVTAAANKLIEMGVADPEKLGVQGTSYGGYATNLLITQTNRFKAAVNISGKVDMVSFYTDSPRLGVRNTHAPEKSQDRIGATLWQQPQKYLAHSAILNADRIKTPLLLMTGEQDHNVPARQAMEMYYALRRLGREVSWVQYTHGGHGMPTGNADEVRDYHQRILDWYEEHLKKPAKEKGKSGPRAATGSGR